MKIGPVSRHEIAGRTSRRRVSSNPFDTTIQKTHVWLNELMSDLDWQERPHKAYLALRTVLHALRDRLTVGGGCPVWSTTTHAHWRFLLRGLDAQGKAAQRAPQERFP